MDLREALHFLSIALFFFQLECHCDAFIHLQKDFLFGSLTANQSYYFFTTTRRFLFVFFGSESLLQLMKTNNKRVTP